MDNFLGMQMKKYRSKFHYSQEYVAKYLGVSRTVFTQLENGKRKTSAEELFKLAELFNVSADALLSEDNETAFSSLKGKAFSYKNVLINALSGYLEVNLTKNEIIGNVVDVTESGERIVVNIIDEKGNRRNYDEFEKWWADNMLLSDRAEFLKTSNCKALIGKFEKGEKTVEVACSSKDSNGVNRSIKQKYFMSKLESTGDIYAICVVTDMTAMVRSEAQSKFYFEIAMALSESFENIYYVDITDDSYVSLGAHGTFGKLNLLTTGKNFFAESKQNVRKVAYPDDYDDIISFLKKDHLLSALKNGEVLSTYYRLMVDESPTYYRMRASMPKTDNAHIIVAVENVNDSVTNDQIRQSKLKRNQQIFEILSSEYSSIFYVDLVSDSYEIYKFDNDTHKLPKDMLTGNLGFSEMYRMCVESIIHEYDRAKMLKAGSIYNILTTLTERNSFTVPYRTKDGVSPRYCEMKVVKVGDETLPSAVVIGFADKDDEKNRELEKSKNINMIIKLADNFEAVCDIDLCSGRCECYADNKLFLRDINPEIAVDDVVDDLLADIGKSLYDEDRIIFRNTLTKDYFMKNLMLGQDLQMDFRVLSNGVPSWYHLKAVKYKQEDSSNLIVGIFNIEQQRAKEQHYLGEVQELSHRANYDALTGVKNRNAYILMEMDMTRLMNLDQSVEFAVVVFDINNLKDINDALGHNSGDEFIKEASALICKVFKQSHIFRIGGDEFVAILRGQDYDDRLKLLEKIRDKSMASARDGGFCLACGIADKRESDASFSEIFKRADADMYKNKTNLKKVKRYNVSNP